MTRDEVIELALEVGAYKDESEVVFLIVKELEQLVERVAAHEREACAKMCESQYRDYEWAIHERDGAESCAAAIRARGKE